MMSRMTGAAVLLIWSGVVLVWVSVPGQTGLHTDPVRVLVVGSYLAAAPGTALVVALGLRDKLLAAVVALGFSGALLVLLAQATLYLHIWSPMGAAGGLVGFTCAMSLTALVRGLTAPQRRPQQPGARP